MNEDKAVQLVSDRRRLLDLLSLEGKSCAEIGVCSGSYASEIRARRPKILHLVDSWAMEGRRLFTPGEIENGMGENGYLAVRLKFGKDPSVVITRKTSFEASLSIQEKTLDFVYIDAAHGFADVFCDLLLWYPKLKKGGWLAGHDFNLRRYKVREAVEAFLLRSGERIRFVTQENSPHENSHSFAIEKTR
jgi:hypothetical protein